MESHQEADRISEPEDIKRDRLLYSQDILEKKFGLYQWISAQNNIMLAVNALLFGFAYNFFSNRFCNINEVWEICLVLLSILSISASTILCLFTALPTIKSALWKTGDPDLIEASIRTVIGINTFELRDYVEKMKSINYDQMLEYNSDEILKVNHNIFKYSIKLRFAVAASAIGLCLLVCALVITLLRGNSMIT